MHMCVCVCVAKVSEWQHPHDGSMGIEMKVSKHNANTYRRACHAVRCCKNAGRLVVAKAIKNSSGSMWDRGSVVAGIMWLLFRLGLVPGARGKRELWITSLAKMIRCTLQRQEFYWFCCLYTLFCPQKLQTPYLLGTTGVHEIWNFCLSFGILMAMGGHIILARQELCTRKTPANFPQTLANTRIRLNPIFL